MLDSGPFTVIGCEATVQIQFESVLDGSAVNLGYETAGARERLSNEAGALAECCQLVRRECLPRPSQT
jgi:hypothetical protein